MAMPAISDLEPLIGTWTSTIHHEAFDPDPVGKMTMEWLKDENVILQRSDGGHESFPEGVVVIMAEEGEDSFAAHYFDSRAVTRSLRMSFDGRVWKWWRKASGPDDFDQRFEGTLSEDGETIDASTHRVEDGEWIHDFDLTYERV